jgi:L,D-transpeptidase ErfK/SrfK
MRARSLLAMMTTAAVFTACAAPVKSPVRPEATTSSTGLPPHAVEVDYGLWSCERGYVLRARRCVPEEEIAHESKVEMFGGAEPVDLEAPAPRKNPLTAMPGFAWNESDFPSRPVVAYPFSRIGADPTTVIGERTPHTFVAGKTVYEAARHAGLGINQVAEAYPDLDFLAPPVGGNLDLPTSWVLPESDDRGLVINVPEMRIYYFPIASPGTVITYPVGLGRDDWRTPIERFHVIEKKVDPPWLIPDSIRAEHIRERNDPRTMIPGGDPENPLGHYRLRLDLPLYGIHGTNIPWGIGMQVTHGCIRLYPEDIQQLFSMVPIGTPGQFVYQPLKVGIRAGAIYAEVHPDIYATGFNYVREAMQLLALKGWSNRVDWDLLTKALEERRAIPVRISREATGSGLQATGEKSGSPVP